MPLDFSKVCQCLSSNNDLAETERRFASEFRKVHQSSTGKAPTEMEFVSALQGKNLVTHASEMALGRSNSTNYLALLAMEASNSISGFAQFEVSASGAATMLWGCSSGTMRDMSNLGRMSPPNNYLVAGWWVLS